jgi:hypothetical protein
MGIQGSRVAGRLRADDGFSELGNSIRVSVKWKVPGRDMGASRIFVFDMGESVETNYAVFEERIVEGLAYDMAHKGIDGNVLVVDVIFQDDYTPTPDVLERFVDMAMRHNAPNTTLAVVHLGFWGIPHAASDQRDEIYFLVGRLVNHVAGRKTTARERTATKIRLDLPQAAGFQMNDGDRGFAIEMVRQGGLDFMAT